MQAKLPRLQQTNDIAHITQIIVSPPPVYSFELKYISPEM
jgi:hypothetical protein